MLSTLLLGAFVRSNNGHGIGTDASSLEVVKVSLTTTGGIGGVGYLVIKYRERASAERDEAEQKLLRAVERLGSESPQVRIAGVYALADVADTYRGDYRQRVVNILCGYLRTSRGTWETITETNGNEGEVTSKKAYISKDGAVESTVLEVLSTHLREQRERDGLRPSIAQQVLNDQLWCDCTFDLHGTCFIEHAVFTEMTFKSIANFRDATFYRGANFKRSRFRDTIFTGALFIESGAFSYADFEGIAVFSDTTFNMGATFLRATFYQEADFMDSTILMNAEFSYSRFCRDSTFERAEIYGAHFQGARFAGDLDTFALQGDVPDFRGTHFNADIDYRTLRILSIDEDTGLPPGASWARFDDEGNVIEVLPSERPSPENKPDDAS